MKILMINVVCGIKSTGRICTDLAVALEKEGHNVKIAYGRETVPEQFEMFGMRIGNNLDNILHGIKARILDADGLGSRRATKKFIKWVDDLILILSIYTICMDTILMYLCYFVIL